MIYTVGGVDDDYLNTIEIISAKAIIEKQSGLSWILIKPSYNTFSPRSDAIVSQISDT